MLRRYERKTKRSSHNLNSQNEDLLAMAVEYLVRADLRYDEKLTPNIDYHRYVYVIYAVKTYLSALRGKKNSRENGHQRLTIHVGNEEIEVDTHDKSAADPVNIAIDNEEKLGAAKRFEELLECPTLTAKQRQYLKLRHQEDMIPSQIARQLGINRWAVQQTINRAHENIKKWLTTSGAT